MYEIPRSIAIVAEDWDLDTHENYSGRFMYGKTCFGVSGSVSNLIGFIADIAIRLDEIGMADIVFEMAQNMSTDNMGWDTIFYFPSLTVIADEDNTFE